jgi:acyl carrier protein
MNINRPDTGARVAAIVQAVSRSKIAIDPAASLFDSGVLDSFALPELVAALEQEFGVKIPDADLNADTFESVDKIAAYVLTRE